MEYTVLKVFTDYDEFCFISEQPLQKDMCNYAPLLIESTHCGLTGRWLYVFPDRPMRVECEWCGKTLEFIPRIENLHKFDEPKVSKVCFPLDKELISDYKEIIGCAHGFDPRSHRSTPSIELSRKKNGTSLTKQAKKKLKMLVSMNAVSLKGGDCARTKNEV